VNPQNHRPPHMLLALVGDGGLLLSQPPTTRIRDKRSLEFFKAKCFRGSADPEVATLRGQLRGLPEVKDFSLANSDHHLSISSAFP